MSAVDALRTAYRREEDTLDAVRLDRASLVSIEQHFGVASPEADRARADLAEALAATEDAGEARRVAAAGVLAEREAEPTRRLVIAGRLRGAPTVDVMLDDPCALAMPRASDTWKVGEDGHVRFSDGSWCSDPSWRPHA